MNTYHHFNLGFWQMKRHHSNLASPILSTNPSFFKPRNHHKAIVFLGHLVVKAQLNSQLANWTCLNFCVQSKCYKTVTYIPVFEISSLCVHYYSSTHHYIAGVPFGHILSLLADLLHGHF